MDFNSLSANAKLSLYCTGQAAMPQALYGMYSTGEKYNANGTLTLLEYRFLLAP